MPSTKTKALAVGDKAPQFSGADETGRTWSLKALKGKTVVLFFYPKDNTSGCTTEACEFRDRYDNFVKKGARIVGVSPDSSKSHAGFKAKHGLPFPLIADEDKEICNAYGVWQEKTLYGRKFMGVVRSTFVIGPTGRILQAMRKVSVADHASAVLEAV